MLGSACARTPIFLIGLTVTILFVLVAVFARWIAPTTRSDYLIGRSVGRAIPFPGPEPVPHSVPTIADGPAPRPIVGSQQTLLVAVFVTIISLARRSRSRHSSGAFGGDRLGVICASSTSCCPCRRCSRLLDRGAGEQSRTSGRSSSRSRSPTSRSSPDCLQWHDAGPAAQRSRSRAAFMLSVKPGPIIFRHCPIPSVR